MALRRQLGVGHPIACQVHHKLMQVMTDREKRYLLEDKIRVDDAYLGGEYAGGKVERGSENNVPFIAGVSLTEEGRALRARLTSVSGFTSEAASA